VEEAALMRRRARVSRSDPNKENLVMKTENIIGALAILVSVGAVGCGAGPTVVAGGPSALAVGGAGSGGTFPWTPPETARPEPPAPSNEFVHMHGARMNHSVSHVSRR
jgi:hypothetical protein